MKTDKAYKWIRGLDITGKLLIFIPWAVNSAERLYAVWQNNNG